MFPFTKENRGLSSMSRKVDRLPAYVSESYTVTEWSVLRSTHRA